MCIRDSPGTAARAANGDQGQMLGASVQKAEEAVQGSAEEFARISDFGEMQRQEVELRRIRDACSVECDTSITVCNDCCFDTLCFDDGFSGRNPASSPLSGRRCSRVKVPSAVRQRMAKRVRC